MLSLLLPGQAYTYYGEEIAMLDVKIPWDKTIDPMGCARTKDTYESFSRDPARTPMQWNVGVSAGFSTNETTYLPVHNEYTLRNVEVQRAPKRSNLNTYKKLTKLRKDPVFTHGVYELESMNDNRTLIMKRSLEGYPTYLVIVNLWIRKENINLTSLYPDISDDLEIVVASSNAIYNKDTIPKESILLTANAALVLKGNIKSDEPILPIETTTKIVTTTVNETVTESTTSIPTLPTDIIITVNSSLTTELDTSSTTTEMGSTTTERDSLTTESSKTKPTHPSIPTTPSVETTTQDDNSATTNISTFIFILSTSFIVTILSRFLTV